MLMTLFVSRSETDVLGRVEWVPLHSVQGPACPVRIVNQFLACWAQGSQFLVHEDGSPLSRFQFQAILKLCLGFVGVSPGYYGTHSFRIGAAMEAAKVGLSNSDVQRIGSWRSSCFAGYVRPELLVTFYFSGGVTPAVWLIGHSYLCRAAQQAESGPGGRSLGLHHVEVYWRGVLGLR